MMLDGKVAVITGGSRGIGKELARSFLAHGASVAIVARDSAVLESARTELGKPGTLAAFSADVGDYASVQAAVRAIRSAFGSPDILINAAGVHGWIGPFAEVPMEDWEDAIRTNLFGTVHMIHALVPVMQKNQRGSIINFSGGGASGARPFFSAYAVSKTAVVRLTETLAAEWRKKDVPIDINIVAPGAINTRLLDEMLETGRERVGAAEYKNLLRQKKDGGASVARVAELCLFLASSQSNGLSGKFLSAQHDSLDDIRKNLDGVMNSDLYTLRRITPKDRGYEW